MAKYFNYFPTTFYSSNNTTSGLDVVTNLISRFGFESKLKENTAAFYKYQIQESDTPEIIASKYYDNPERHWMVLLFNDIVDPQWDWPLKQNDLIEFIDEKYAANGAANSTVQSGIAWALSENNVQSYFKVITTTGDNNTIDVRKLQVDFNTYVNVAATTTNYTTANNESVTVAITKETRSYYTYEVEQNESKREIKLLKKEFVPAVEKEFRRVIST